MVTTGFGVDLSAEDVREYEETFSLGRLSITYGQPSEGVSAIEYKYDEPRLLEEMKSYVDKTYTAHYTGSGDVQVMDLLASGETLMEFSAASIIKYAYRFGRKAGMNRKDLLKIMHYAMFMLWHLDQQKTVRD